jgi:hypothetical protein
MRSWTQDPPYPRSSSTSHGKPRHPTSGFIVGVGSGGNKETSSWTCQPRTGEIQPYVALPHPHGQEQKSRDETVHRAFSSLVAILSGDGRRAALDRAWLVELLQTANSANWFSHSLVSGTVPCWVVGRSWSALALDDAMTGTEKNGWKSKKIFDLISVCRNCLYGWYI